MIQCYFGKEHELSDKWMVRAMNFGQDRPKDVLKTTYQMIIEVDELNAWSKTIFQEIKDDAQNFPEDWGMLGQLLKTSEGIDFTTLLKIDTKAAHEFVVEFSYDILLTIEKQGTPWHLKPTYQLNTVDNIEIKEQTLIFQGQAFLMNG